MRAAALLVFASTVCGAEGHAPVILLQRRHHLHAGLGLQQPAVTQDEILLRGAVGHRQQAVHQLDEAVVLQGNDTFSLV